MENQKFIKTNILDSKSLDDIRDYAVSGLDYTNSTTMDFYGTNELMNAHLWTHEHFNYVFNEYGFREDSFPNQTDIGAFGCSFTFGTGLPQEQLWHKALARKKDCSSLNFGLPGRSIASIIDIFLIVSKHIKMQSAVFLFPSYVRTQLAVDNPKLHNTINYVDTDVNFKSSVTDQFGVDSNAVYRALSDAELLKITRDKVYLLNHIAKFRNIHVYVSSWEEKTYKFLSQMDLDNITVLPRWQSLSTEFAKTDLARDGMHPGVKHHKFWATAINDHINI